jgi:hypothetical protein
MHEPGGRFASQADAVAAAKKYDLITIRPGQLDTFAPAMRAANPKLKIFVYMNGSYFYKGQVKDTTADMVSHDAGAAVVKSKNFGNTLGDPSSASYISFKEKEAVQTIQGGQGDGVYLDMLGSAPTMPGYNTGLAINKATGKAWTASQWLNATSNVAAQISSYTHRPVLGNGFGNGPRYYNPAGSSKVLLNGATGMTAEAWLKAPASSATTFETEAQWKQEVDMLADANKAGGETLTMTKTWGGGTVAQITSYRLYALSTFLLGNTGQSLFYFSGAKKDKATVDSPLYHLPLGKATASYTRLSTGAYQRTFTGGRVLVNPTTKSITVSLGQTLKTSAGKATSTVTLAPHTGEILTTS